MISGVYFILLQSPAKETFLLHSPFPITEGGMVAKCTIAIRVLLDLAQYVLTRLAQHVTNYQQFRRVDSSGIKTTSTDFGRCLGNGWRRKIAGSVFLGVAFTVPCLVPGENTAHEENSGNRNRNKKTKIPRIRPCECIDVCRKGNSLQCWWCCKSSIVPSLYEDRTFHQDGHIGSQSSKDHCRCAYGQ